MAARGERDLRLQARSDGNERWHRARVLRTRAAVLAAGCWGGVGTRDEAELLRDESKDVNKEGGRVECLSPVFICMQAKIQTILSCVHRRCGPAIWKVEVTALTTRLRHACTT
jgi:hypothetical protein